MAELAEMHTGLDEAEVALLAGKGRAEDLKLLIERWIRHVKKEDEHAPQSHQAEHAQITDKLTRILGMAILRSPAILTGEELAEVVELLREHHKVDETAYKVLPTVTLIPGDAMAELAEMHTGLDEAEVALLAGKGRAEDLKLLIERWIRHVKKEDEHAPQSHQAEHAQITDKLTRKSRTSSR